jgi:hypothetical protein
MFSLFYDDQSYIGTSSDYQDLGEIKYRDNGTNSTGQIYIPSGGTHTFNIWNSGLGAAMVILIAAMAIGIIAGFGLFGSGLTEMSQGMIFSGVLFLGLWASLSVVSVRYLFDSGILSLFWVSLTVMFVVGVGTHMTNSGDF